MSARRSGEVAARLDCLDGNEDRGAILAAEAQGYKRYTAAFNAFFVGYLSVLPRQPTRLTSLGLGAVS
jgi:hypothetical protein